MISIKINFIYHFIIKYLAIFINIHFIQLYIENIFSIINKN